MRILITGGAGFIGTEVTAQAVAAGHEVVVLDRVATDVRVDGASYVQDDLLTMTADVLDGVEAVCHQAAKVGLGVDLDDMPDYVTDNALGTARLLVLMARRGVSRLVLASSMVVYGEGAYACAEHGLQPAAPRPVERLEQGLFEPPCPVCGADLVWLPVTEDRPFDPRNAYAASKCAQEHLAAAWARAAGGAAVALRYHNVYGPGLPQDTPYAGVVALFLSRLRRGEPPQVFEDGGMTRDFVHVRDVAAANLSALALDPQPGLVACNVSSGVPTTVGAMAGALAQVCDGPSPVLTGQYRLGDVRHVLAAPDRAAALLGFRAQVPLEIGLKELADG